PAESAFPGTCLGRVGGRGIGVETVLVGLCRSLRRWLDRWAAEGFQPVREAWLARAWRLGETIEVRLEGAALAGRFAELEASGTLVLDLADGTRRRISAGDVLAHPVTT
ncbi:MAG: biotin--[acetyl-CoA-carboxylase] ligase, partial [Alphaproteobacteria bacterium]